MPNYLKNSLQKVKQDALSKVIYDILKYFGVFAITLLFAKFIPSSSAIGNFLNFKLEFSRLNIGLIIVITVFTTLAVTLVYSKKKYKILQQDNFTDELTGLLNQKALKEQIPKIIDTCRRQNHSLSFILIDVDDFKLFNKNYSYQIADQVLAKVGQLLKSDSRATDTTFRQYLKGDEFLVVAKETELSNAVFAAERKRKLLNTVIEVDGVTYQLTVCCGVTEFNFPNDTLETVLLRVKNAKDLAKSKPGKNVVESIV